RGSRGRVMCGGRVLRVCQREPQRLDVQRALVHPVSASVVVLRRSGGQELVAAGALVGRRVVRRLGVLCVGGDAESMAVAVLGLCDALGEYRGGSAASAFRAVPVAVIARLHSYAGLLTLLNLA